jgi:hypothetical protein
VKGYCLPYSYGFIDLKYQLADRALQCFVFLIERIHFLQKAVGIAHGSRILRSSREIEFATHNETVRDASQSKRNWSRKFLHSIEPCLLPELV